MNGSYLHTGIYNIITKQESELMVIRMALLIGNIKQLLLILLYLPVKWEGLCPIITYSSQ